jgi:hypothetical protein
MQFLSRDALLGERAKAIPRERVEVPELDGVVYVRGMTGKERGEWEASLTKGRGVKARPNTANGRATMLVRCLVDEKGDRIFQNGDADALGDIRVDVLNRLFQVANRLSGSDQEELDEVGNGSAETSTGSNASPTN